MARVCFYPRPRLCFVASSLALALSASALPAIAAEPAAVAAEPTAMPATPAAARGVLYARAFTVDVPFAYEWSAERPAVGEGMLLVLEADPALLRPRETQEPVLFVGRHPAQRVSRGWQTGRIVVLVPARVDLATEPVWFGTPGLPEQVDAATAAAERTLAAARGVRPLPAAAVAAARQRGGDAARFPDALALDRAALQLVRDFVDTAPNLVP